jgi:hypothetical protein
MLDEWICLVLPLSWLIVKYVNDRNILHEEAKVIISWL